MSGYTPTEIDEMEFADFEMLSSYWAEHPPVHIMMAGYLGIKPKKTINRKQTPEQMIELLKGVPGFAIH